MEGYIIEYHAIDAKSRTMLNHILFGRLVYRNYRGRKTAYYIQGMLDQTKFYRLLDSKIFVTSIDDLNFEELRLFGKVLSTKSERDIAENVMKTGEEHWQSIATEKNIVVRTRRRSKNDR